MSIEFKFKIGDVVANSLHVEEVGKFYDKTELSLRPQTLRVEERISIECVGGVQLFYGCRTKEGVVEKHAEGILVPAEVLWDAWLDGVLKQGARKKATS